MDYMITSRRVSARPLPERPTDDGSVEVYVQGLDHDVMCVPGVPRVFIRRPETAPGRWIADLLESNVRPRGRTG